jgi:hypothetical protein
MALLFCKPFGDFLCPEDRPSPIFSTWSVLINAVGIVWGVIRLITASGCTDAARTWCILGIISHGVPIIFGIYIYIRFVHKIREGKAAAEAAWKLLLYDWGVCLFILFLIWLLAWMIVAGGKSSGGGDCGGQISVSIVLFIMFLIVGFLLLVFSVFTECCRTPRWYGNRQGGAPTVVVAQPAPAYIPGATIVQPGPPAPGYAQPAPAPAQTYGRPTPPATNPNYRG